MSLVELDHCVIHVSDWERSNAFYRDVIGAEIIVIGNGLRARRPINRDRQQYHHTPASNETRHAVAA